MCDQMLHRAHNIASLFLLTALPHSRQGYFDLHFIFSGPGFGSMSPQARSFLSRWKVLMPFELYWILVNRNRFARGQLTLTVV